LNVRSIRAMSLEFVLQQQFDRATSACLATGIRGAFVEGVYIRRCIGPSLLRRRGTYRSWDVHAPPDGPGR